MDCSRIPPSRFWDEEAPEKLHAYRLHIQFCSHCRADVLKNSPEQLLFELRDEPMPEEFWLGFWDSVSRKRKTQTRNALKTSRIAVTVRWIAVLIVGLAIGLYGRSLPESERSTHELTSDYPVIENLKNPQARYYIFQTSRQKVIMVFDPEIEL